MQNVLRMFLPVNEQLVYTVLGNKPRTSLSPAKTAECFFLW